MTKPLFTEEEAESLAQKHAFSEFRPSPARRSFLAGIAAAEVEFQKRLAKTAMTNDEFKKQAFIHEIKSRGPGQP